MRDKILNTQLPAHQIGLFYLGQEGYIIKYREQYYMVDAYLSDYVDRNCCTDEVKWVRNYAPPVSAGELDFVDYVFCTHAHYDHADPDTLTTLGRINQKAKFIMPAPVADTLKSYGIPQERIVYARDGECLQLGAASVLPIPAAHEQLNRDDNGDFMELGYLFTLGECKLFHAGDCCIYDTLAERLGRLDVAMLPVNGRDYYRLRRDIIGNMTAREAIELAKQTDTKLMVPMHFDLYDCNCISAAAFADTHSALGDRIPYHIFQPGERYIYCK